ncbi:aquaporin-8 [Trichosurus vulpecula]|uniref:aquaporin-8 n=1 Tax=Trichosurus vulpecula TaxID=9337 RepID=UPI00186B2595|nr:aquaporin-8 [Trichosurus vulpecula]
MGRVSLKEMKCLPKDHTATVPMCELNSGNMTMKEKDPESRYDTDQLHWYEKYLQPCIVELLGSALFIFIGCLSVIENVEGVGRLQPALAHGLALGVTIAFLGKISGGHFNPAVSLAVMLIGGLNYMMLIPFCISQVVGGIIGAALAKAVSTEERFLNASGAAFTTIGGDDQVGGAVVAEIVMTLFLILTVCMAAVNEKSKSPLAPFCIGFAVTVDILAGGAISGACMNPARAFGPAVMANYWKYQWVYWVGPLAASLVAGALIRVLIGDQKTRLFLKRL